MRKVNAISRHSNGKTVSAKLDDYGCEGVFLLDGTIVSGTLGTLSQEELAFKIWAQLQSPKLTGSELQKLWEKNKSEK